MQSSQSGDVTTADSSGRARFSLIRFYAGLLHLLLFALSLFFLVPNYASDGRKYNAPTELGTVLACTAFLLSLVVARLLKWETSIGLLCKIAVFVLFASWTTHVMRDMAGPIVKHSTATHSP